MSTKKILISALMLIVFLFVGYKIIDLRLYKLILGQARFIQKSNAEIKGNSKILHNSFAYRYEDEDSEKIIFFLENETAYKNRNIIIIDPSSSSMGRPNTNIRDYSRWGSCIFQNDSGEKFIPFRNDIKRAYFNPMLRINENYVSFKLPEEEGYPFDSISIEFKKDN